MSGLTVRTFSRMEIDLPVEFVVCDEHREQVRLSPTSGSDRACAVRGRTMDVSQGGIGLITRHFLPRMSEGVLRVFQPGPDVPQLDSGAAPGDSGPVFEHRVRVCRISMQGPEPSYLIGLAYVDPDAALEPQVLRLLQWGKPVSGDAPVNHTGASHPHA